MSSLKKISTDWHRSIVCLMYSVYLAVLGAFYGWQVIAFIVSYSDLSAPVIHTRLSQWNEWQPLAMGILFILMAVIFIFRNDILSCVAPETLRFMLHMKIQFGVIALVLLNYLLLRMDAHIHFFELLGFGLTLWALFMLGFQFYRAPNQAWQHPTTIGSIFISSLLLGLSVIAVFQVFELSVKISVLYFIVLLLFDMFIFFGRFRFLSKMTRSTNQVAQRLMSSMLLFTGIRIILGIFIPLVYGIFMIISDQNFVRGIGLMIIIALIIDRFLFIYPSVLPSDKTNL